MYNAGTCDVNVVNVRIMKQGKVVIKNKNVKAKY